MKTNRKASTEIRYRLADNLKRLRKERGYTQEELGRLCRLSKSYIGDIEQARVNVTLASLETLARGLSSSEVDLLLPRRRTQP